MERPVLIIMVGNIGAGKSTLTKALREKGFYVVSRDGIRYSLGAGQYVWSEETEPAVFVAEMSLFETLVEKKLNIVLDEINVSKEMRRRYISYASLFDYEIQCIVLPRISKEESVKRRCGDNHGQATKELWESVWVRFDNMYQEPTEDEGIHQITRL